MIFTLPQLDFWAIAPVVAMTLAGCLVMLVDIFTPRRSGKGHLAIVSLAGLAIAAGLSFLTWNYENQSAWWAPSNNPRSASNRTPSSPPAA